MTEPLAIVSRCLRTLLAPLSPGDAIEDSQDFTTFQSALEHVLPSLLGEACTYWRYQGLDGFRFAVARKVGLLEAEFIGLSLLVDSQTWIPLHLRLGVAPLREEI